MLNKNIKMEWIKTKDELPKEGVYVLVKHTRGTWHDSTDQEGVNFKVAKLVKGISIKEREAMDDSNPRKIRYTAADEHGNNKVPYYFNTFGTDSFFGQVISHWAYFTRP